MARLVHPNIAQIYSYGICNGMPYMAMELASGGSLYSIMNANPGKTDIARVIKICQQVAQALQCASDQGFVHGDVKPENILLDDNGNAKLVDFGLAAMCMARGAVPVDQNGRIYSDDNIGLLLEQRNMAKRLRRGGARLKGPKPRRDSQDAAFERTLRSLLSSTVL